MQKMIIATLILLSFSACKNTSDNSIKPDLVSLNLDTTIYSDYIRSLIDKFVNEYPQSFKWSGDARVRYSFNNN